MRHLVGVTNELQKENEHFFWYGAYGVNECNVSKNCREMTLRTKQPLAILNFFFSFILIYSIRLIRVCLYCLSVHKNSIES